MTFLTEAETRRAARRAPTAPPGPGAATTRCCSRRPDRAARLRADRPDLRRHPARPRRSRQLHRQRTKAADHAADHDDGRRAAGLAARARRPANRPAVPDPHRQHAQPRRARAPADQTRRRRRQPDARRCHAKRVTMHVLRHTAAMRLLSAGVDTSVIALWLGHEQDRNDPDLPARRPRDQGTGPRQDQAPQRQTRPLPAARQTPRLPRSALIMPTSPPRITTPKRDHNPRSA